MIQYMKEKDVTFQEWAKIMTQGESSTVSASVAVMMTACLIM
jgi:hypothetical protein